MLVSGVAACSLLGSEDATLASTDIEVQAPSLAGDGGRPVVEVLAPREDDRPPLDPDADPQTPLGRLRARYFPVWTQEFDGAFPPETCGTAWELDGVAEPAGGVDISLYGEVPIMAALAVMRYEHLVSRALASPTPVAQLCVAVGSVGPARTAALDSLQEALETGRAASSGASRPSEVTLVAVGPSAVLAVACVGPQASATTRDSESGEAHSPIEPTYLGAYLLRVSRGHEDRVADTSYRVFEVDHRESPGCADWEPWLTQWETAVDAWRTEGQIWQHDGQQVTVEAICNTPPAAGEPDCPRQWPLQ